jgi:hypothetical protein
LAKLLIAYGLNGDTGFGVALNYVSGFSKINDPDRFKPDTSDDELTRFGRAYRPSARDIRRVQYLYPGKQDAGSFDKYLSVFGELIKELKRRGIGLIVIKPPLPARFYDLIPSEAEFDRGIGNFLARQQVPFYNFGLLDNEEQYFFDSDHLNRSGVINFFDRHLIQVLRRHREVR